MDLRNLIIETSFRYVIQRRDVVDNLVKDTLSIVSEYKDQDRPVIGKIA